MNQLFHNMGIRDLNRFFRNNCSSDAIREIEMKTLQGKTIVVDANIYLYRFKAENAYLENLYLLISLFHHHNITPIFIFDGKTPEEKKELLKYRKTIKKKAQQQYKKIMGELDIVPSRNQSQKVFHTLRHLKQRFTRISTKEIKIAKMLMKAYGVTYYEAEGEADVLCAKLVIKNYAYACLSEDMDLFVYGCSRVLRYLSLRKRQIVFYDLKKILSELNLTQIELKEICMVSGTDYNYQITKKKTNLYQTLKYFKEFKKSNCKDFYLWLEQNTDYIEDFCKLYNTYSLFDTTTFTFLMYSID